VIVFSIFSFLLYWAGLYGSKDAESLKAGGRRLMIKAAELARGSLRVLIRLRLFCELSEAP
jgi:hypothetical protein